MLDAGDVGAPPTPITTLLLVDARNLTRQEHPGQGHPHPEIERVGHRLAKILAAHRGMRLNVPGRDDRLAITFESAGDAMSCAIALQRTPLSPIRLRIAAHTGAVATTGDDNGSGPVTDRVARLCDLANDGQILLSGAAGQAAADRLPADAWLTDLGVHRLPGVQHPERVAQLCHRDLVNDFAALQAQPPAGAGSFPARLTSFVGRAAELEDLRRLASDHRLVTLTGTGGVGKTRLAQQLAGEMADRSAAGAWWVDLAPITDPDLVPQRAARTLGLPSQPGRSWVDTLVGFIGDRQVLLVLDNCEHLLDACAALLTTLLGACTGLQVIATSREPVGVAGEMTWPTPSLSLAGEAVELFLQRARLIRPDFGGAGDDAAAVEEICRRLDGVPLAIELAATLVRALSLPEIADGLRDRLELLTGGARTTEPRQQTLRASVDWSHDLLSHTERVVFHRLAVFAGGFDLDAARAVVVDAGLLPNQILDNLVQLVEKSLLMADNSGQSTRYRLLETVRHYALEKLDEAGEVDAARTAHRDHYTALFETGMSAGYQWHIEHAEVEIDNLRAAFAYSREHGDVDPTARLASSLLPLWIHSRTSEGLAWFGAVLTDSGALAPAAHARALADRVILQALTGDYYHIAEADQAVAIARKLDNPALLGWALAAGGFTCCYSPELALPYFAEALDELASASGDDWRLSQILGVQAFSAYVAGDLATMHLAAKRGRDLADRIGNWSTSRLCRLCIGLAHLHHGEPARAAAQAGELATEAEAAQDPLFSAQSLMLQAEALACIGDIGGARAAAEASVAAAVNLPAFHLAISFGALVDTSLAAGDLPAGLAASDALRDACALPQVLAINGNPVARSALASGHVPAARHWADEALAVASGVHRRTLLETRVRVAIAEGDVDQAERDAHDALAVAAETEAYLVVPDIIESLAALATDAGRHHEATSLFGAAAGIRERSGLVRYKIYDADHTAAVDALRNVMEPTDFENSWTAGATLSTADAITFARKSDTGHNHPSSGWDALTPAELDIARLVGEGLRNKDIAEKLVVSIRTVHAHLTHIYAKLGTSSRAQLAEEATRRA